MSKLNNIKAVKEMLGGEHKTQTKKTISFTDKVVERREVGETWVDDKGQKWEQRNGYKVKVGKMAKLREELKTFPNCNKETCTCIEPGQADMKMKAIHGMCLDCVTLMEYDLKQNGGYEEYERKKMLSNAEAWLKQAELEKEVLKELPNKGDIEKTVFPDYAKKGILNTVKFKNAKWYSVDSFKDMEECALEVEKIIK